MKCKKILALVLSCVMLLSVLAACNSQKPVETQPQETQDTSKPVETQPKETEDNTITFPLKENMELSVMYVLGNASYPVTDNIAWKHLQEIWNITFNTTEFAPAEATEKMNLLMSSGEYSEVLFKANKIDINQYGMDGILIPLEELIKEYMPNLCALLDERDGWKDIAAADGHVYSLPNFTRTDPNQSNGMYWWINKGWLDKLGLEMPDTPEELYDVLKAFKEKDPNGNGIADEIPLAARADVDYTHLLGLFGDGLHYSNYWMVMDGQMEYLPTTEYFKENLLELFSKMYTEGILNPDMFTMDQDQFRAVCGGEEVIYGMLWDSSCAYFSDENERYNWVTLKPFDTDNYAIGKGFQLGGLAITDKCKNPEIVLSAVDYLYSEEGGKVVRMGVEGVSYKINEDGTWENLKENFDSVTYQATLMGSASVPAAMPDLYYDMPAAEATRWTNNECWGAGYGVGSQGVIMPGIVLTEEENEEYSILFTDISAYVNNYVAECTTGIVSIEDTWDEFQATLKQMQVERMIEIYRAAYERAAG